VTKSRNQALNVGWYTQLKKAQKKAFAHGAYIAFAIAVIGPVGSILFSDEFKVSPCFVVSAVVVPLVALGVAFALQTVNTFSDFKRHLELNDESSKLMRLLEEAFPPLSAGSGFYDENTERLNVALRLMYEKTVEELHRRLRILRDCHCIEAFDDYWNFCTVFYTLARREVECTSVIDLRDWEKDDMQDYLRMQREELIARGITVRRTFVFEHCLDKDQERRWRDLTMEQARAGFQLYYVVLTEIAVGDQEQTSKVRMALKSDFALIDQDILQFADYSPRTAQEVLYYQFFAISAPPNANGNVLADSLPHRSKARSVFSKKVDYRLLIQEHRNRISAYKWKHSSPVEGDSFCSTYKAREKSYSGPLVDQNSTWQS